MSNIEFILCQTTYDQSRVYYRSLRQIIWHHSIRYSGILSSKSSQWIWRTSKACVTRIQFLRAV